MGISMMKQRYKKPIYKQRLQRLQSENEALQEKLKVSAKYRNEYKELCEQTKKTQEEYKEKLEIFKGLEKEYTQYLSDIKG